MLDSAISGVPGSRRQAAVLECAGFLGLTIDNALLYVDVIVMPEIDLSVWRNLPGLLALGMLLYGLVWDSK